MPSIAGQRQLNPEMSTCVLTINDFNAASMRIDAIANDGKTDASAFYMSAQRRAALIKRFENL